MIDIKGIHIQYLSQSQLSSALTASKCLKRLPLLLLEHSQQQSTLPVTVSAKISPFIHILSGLNSISENKYELWTADESWAQSSLRLDNETCLSFCCNSDYLIGSLSVPLLPGESVQQLSQHYYKQIINFVIQQDKPHLLRMWNYFPQINQSDNELERYQAFCIGRHNAFSQQETKALQYPAASAVGSHSDRMVVLFIATKKPGQFLENPDQVSAYHYPQQYSPKSPSFARASIFQGDTLSQLYISGTASIVGHESKFHDDIRNQTRQTIKNIQRLIQHTNSQNRSNGEFKLDHPAQAGLERPEADWKQPAIKIYLRNMADRAIVSPIIQKFVPNSSNICYLQADICRQELDIEIEMMLTL